MFSFLFCSSVLLLLFVILKLPMRLLNEVPRIQRRRGIDTSRYVLAIADKHAAEGNLDHACELYRATLDANSEDFWALLAMGTTLLSMGKYADAEVYIRRFMKFMPNSINGSYQLAMCLMSLGRTDELIEVLTRFTQMSQLQPEHPLMCGILHFYKNELDEALSNFNRAVQSMPDSANCFYQRARCFAAMGNAKSALRDLQVSLAMNPRLTKQARVDGVFTALSGEPEFGDILSGAASLVPAAPPDLLAT